jgi:hypothetical protein
MKFTVQWKEDSTINNIVEVEAKNPREAAKKVFPNKKFHYGYGNFMVKVSNGQIFTYLYEVKSRL